MSEIKTIITLAMTWFFAYLWLSQVAFMGLCILLIIDTILGYCNAIFLNKNFSSTTAIVWLLKKVAILFIPISIAVFWKIIWQDINKITAWIFALIWIAQLYSIVGHIYFMHTREKVSEYDAMTIVIKYISDKIHKYLEKLLENNNK